MRTFFSILVLAMFGFALPASADDFVPSPNPSRIVLTPAADGSNSQLVTWRTDAATTTGAVEYRPASGGTTVRVAATPGGPVDFSGWTYVSRHHKATLTGLSPATKYEYRAGIDGNWSDWFTFETAGTDGAPWEMIYFGDAQTGLDTRWRPVVEKAFAHTPNAKLALHAGDMINDPDEDHQWGNWFKGVKGYAETVNQFTVIGNHERVRDLDLKQYGGHFSNAGNGPESLKTTTFYTDFQDVRFIALNGNFFGTEDQPAFLEEALKTNPKKWSIVSFHEPLFAGAKGRDHEWLREALLPIIRKYNVDLVLQGHDHVYARGVMAEDLDTKTGYGSGPVFTVSVAGPKYYDLDPGSDNNWTQNGAVRQVAYDQTSAYQPIKFDGNTLTYRSYIASKGGASTATGEVGDMLDAFTITKLKDGSKIVAEGTTPPDIKDPDPDPDPPKARPKVKINKIVRNKKNATAKVTLTSNMAGKLKVTGKGIRTVTRNLKAKKRVTVSVRTNSVGKKALRRGGRFVTKIKVNVRAKNGKVQNLTRKITLIRPWYPLPPRS